MNMTMYVFPITKVRVAKPVLDNEGDKQDLPQLMFEDDKGNELTICWTSYEQMGTILDKAIQQILAIV